MQKFTKQPADYEVIPPKMRASTLFPLRLESIVMERGGARLLDNITAEIGLSGITLIMGPNGAGKSLLIRLMHALEQPTSGSVQWGGRSANAQTRRCQALVFQRPVLLKRSVAENIDFVLALSGKASRPPNFCNILLERVRLAELQQRPARLLSGGEQQRLALARALASRPNILFLDEPTANLDPTSTKIIEDIVREENNAGTKIIFVTHDLGQAKRLADEVIFLHRGRLMAHQPAARFFDNPQSPTARDYLAGRLIT